MSDGVIDRQQRRWLATEVVQTSAMDCGPASLKCLLEGMGIPVSYGRLREACQTSVDGTSIDRVEDVANSLGLNTEQRLLPVDHVFLPAADVLPAMVVTRHADGATHFAVFWRQWRSWVQVMDPATGRRWVHRQRLQAEIFRHQQRVAADDWRQWAGSDEFIAPLTARMADLHIDIEQIEPWLALALADPLWFGLARLDAATRLVTALREAGGILHGRAAAELLAVLFTRVDQHDIYRHIPIVYWSVTPHQSAVDEPRQLMVQGAVLLQVLSANPVNAAHPADDLSPELKAALQEQPQTTSQTLWDLLRADGLLTPLALAVAIAVAAAAVTLESLLFRGIFDVGWELRSAQQRLAGLSCLLGFSLALLWLEVPIAQQALRMGRQLETRLRMALLSKIPRLNDRYFQSRPISDMAERGHSIALVRSIPNLAVQLTQAGWDLLFTWLGIVLLDVHSGVWAVAIVLLAVALPWLTQPMLNERDLRVRSHVGALFGFYLDAMLGLVPIRAHSAQQAVRREHEGLLTEWARASVALIRVSLMAEAVQALLVTGLVCGLLYQHFLRTGTITGSDLLLVYWALKLPAIGQRLIGVAQQYPAQRNTVLRLLEPLASPEDVEADGGESAPLAADRLLASVAIDFQQVSVMAGGHRLLDGIDLRITPGEQVAIVGPSGAGKSSLLGLLLGWHKPSSGQLRVNGALLQGNTLAALRRHIAWVDPGIQLWNRSLLDNLSFSSEQYRSDDLGQALDSAQLREVIQKLPQGLQTYLGEGGGLLSGGEGQRLRLARALLQRDVQLVLLDEPFRGVERQQRRQLLQEVRDCWPQATLLYVTHDLQETLQFDRVVVIEDAQLCEDGNPVQLAVQSSRYRQLLESEWQLLNQRWQGQHWRRLRLEDGRICEVTS